MGAMVGVVEQVMLGDTGSSRWYFICPSEEANAQAEGPSMPAIASIGVSNSRFVYRPQSYDQSHWAFASAG